jgi:hypothetical protein
MVVDMYLRKTKRPNGDSSEVDLATGDGQVAQRGERTRGQRTIVPSSCPNRRASSTLRSG